MFDGQHRIALHAMHGNRAHHAVRRRSHGFSRVVAVTWDIFSSYGRDGPSQLVFVQ